MLTSFRELGGDDVLGAVAEAPLDELLGSFANFSFSSFSFKSSSRFLIPKSKFLLETGSEAAIVGRFPRRDFFLSP